MEEAKICRSGEPEIWDGGARRFSISTEAAKFSDPEIGGFVSNELKLEVEVNSREGDYELCSMHSGIHFLSSNKQIFQT